MTRFIAAPGLSAALANTNDDRAYFIFEGDLGQIGTIYTRLLDAGFPVVKSNVYPGFPADQEAEYVKALRFVFTARIAGWWNQKRDMLKHEICTDAEFMTALGRA